MLVVKRKNHELEDVPEKKAKREKRDDESEKPKPLDEVRWR